MPILAVFGQQLASDERDHLRRLVPSAQLEEWLDRGHFIHLVEADRFAARLRAFIDFRETRRRASPGQPGEGRRRRPVGWATAGGVQYGVQTERN